MYGSVALRHLPNDGCGTISQRLQLLETRYCPICRHTRQQPATWHTRAVAWQLPPSLASLCRGCGNCNGEFQNNRTPHLSAGPAAAASGRVARLPQRRARQRMQPRHWMAPGSWQCLPLRPPPPLAAPAQRLRAASRRPASRTTGRCFVGKPSRISLCCTPCLSACAARCISSEAAAAAAAAHGGTCP